MPKNICHLFYSLCVCGNVLLNNYLYRHIIYIIKESEQLIKINLFMLHIFYFIHK